MSFELMEEIVGLLVVTVHVIAFVEIVSHQAEAGIVGRVASLLTLHLRDMSYGELEVVGDIFGHHVEIGTYHMSFSGGVTELGGIDDDWHRAKEVEQVIHHHAAAEPRLTYELFFLRLGQNFGVGFFQLINNLCEAAHLPHFLKMLRSADRRTSKILHIFKLRLA